VDDVSVNFIELIALTRITPDSTVEKFGSLINSSFFDASNILATLKQKGLVDFVTAFPSQSTLKLTDKGSAFIAEAAKKATDPIDQLDMAILSQLANGRRNLAELGGALNVAQKDLALHIFKLSSQQNLTYELVNATVSMYLTEKGFVAAKSAPQQQQQPQVPQPDPALYGEAPGQPGQKKVVDEIKILEEISRKRRKRSRMMMLAIIAIVIIVVVVLVLGSKFNFL
jgi:predicted nucleic acid-binding Zn ribbon protein/predicted transcriptional regulator